MKTERRIGALGMAAALSVAPLFACSSQEKNIDKPTPAVLTYDYMKQAFHALGYSQLASVENSSGQVSVEIFSDPKTVHVNVAELQRMVSIGTDPDFQNFIEENPQFRSIGGLMANIDKANPTVLRFGVAKERIVIAVSPDLESCFVSFAKPSEWSVHNKAKCGGKQVLYAGISTSQENTTEETFAIVNGGSLNNSRQELQTAASTINQTLPSLIQGAILDASLPKDASNKPMFEQRINTTLDAYYKMSQKAPIGVVPRIVGTD